ncbi:zinc ribbon domain-containing protein [Paenibacillus abyssi]|uniref:DZANK-type domain-containing protein n=1 Tax=Paenibacillus abyssi TaxID=1340531 RepID=A0A917FWX8_9BACL|nr:zinc ribbon domain-containing protein [Paenibacillus abyssi]GGG09856.1 hypothetical protein GCM10010916_28420 [Paenibacillus abyssi]
MADSKNDDRLCIRCGHLTEKKDMYCISCGAPVTNRCLSVGTLLGDPCSYVCNEQTAFCPRCGSHTAFYQAGLVSSPYPENKVLQTDELDEMNWFNHRFFLDD